MDEGVRDAERCAALLELTEKRRPIVCLNRSDRKRERFHAAIEEVCAIPRRLRGVRLKYPAFRENVDRGELVVDRAVDSPLLFRIDLDELAGSVDAGTALSETAPRAVAHLLALRETYLIQRRAMTQSFTLLGSRHRREPARFS